MTPAKSRYAQQTGLRVIPCACGSKMWEVIHAEAKTRKGWYCPQCKGFVKAIGRERLQ